MSVTTEDIDYKAKVMEYPRLHLIPNPPTRTEQQSKDFMTCMTRAMDSDIQYSIGQLREIFGTAEVKDMTHHAAPIKIMLDRLEYGGGSKTFTYSKWVLLMLSSLDWRPGVLVQWAFWLYRETAIKKSYITMMDLGMEYFQLGFPSDAQLHEAWMKQKYATPRKPDNMIDSPAFWQAVDPTGYNV